MAFDNPNELFDLINEAADLGPDMNESVAGGGTFELPAEGFCKLRLVDYIELGLHNDTVNGQTKKKELVYLGWEITGPKHPLIEATGKPHHIGFTMPLSLNEKANFYKLFVRLNVDKSAKHFAQLLGKAFIGTIVHNTKGEGDQKRTYANLRDKEGITIRPAFKTDDETGENLPIKVDPLIGSPRCFLWEAPKGQKAMWDSIFIDGMWDAADGKEAKSKNYFQNRVRSALNFEGSPIHQLVGGASLEDMDLPGAEQPERKEEDKQASVEQKAGAKTGAAADPLSEAS